MQRQRLKELALDKKVARAARAKQTDMEIMSEGGFSLMQFEGLREIAHAINDFCVDVHWEAPGELPHLLKELIEEFGIVWKGTDLTKMGKNK